MKSHHDWSTTAFDRPPSAEAVGPFPRREFLQAVSEVGCEDVRLVESDTALLPLACEGGIVRFVGHADLTDYHVPLGSAVDVLVADLVTSVPAGTTFVLDSLPAESADLVVAGFDRAEIPADVELHAATAVLDLPATFEAYLEQIGKKQRHELRRKHRRYEERVGPVRHETHRGTGWAFDEFVRLHRLSGGAKSRFMTEDRVELFGTLAQAPGWRVDLLRVPESDRAAACLFSYSDAEGIYLYNSSFDPAYGEGSPGLAVVAATIAQAISEGLHRFDFLKGDEVYKFRLGASERPLYRITART